MSGFPMISSRRRKCAVTAGCERWSCFAAVETFPHWATARNDRKSRRSMSLGFMAADQLSWVGQRYPLNINASDAFIENVSSLRRREFDHFRIPGDQRE